MLRDKSFILIDKDGPNSCFNARSARFSSFTEARIRLFIPENCPKIRQNTSAKYILMIVSIVVYILTK